MSSIPAEATPLPGGISANALSSLFGAINGLRNRRALIAMMGCLVGGVLVVGLLSQMGAFDVLPRRPGLDRRRRHRHQCRRRCCTWTTRAASRRAAPSMRSSTA